MQKITGIETALAQRENMVKLFIIYLIQIQDIENRHSKQFWLACQNLIESICFGQKSGNDSELRRKPLIDEVCFLINFYYFFS